MTTFAIEPKADAAPAVEVSAAYIPEVGTFAISGPDNGGLGVALEGADPEVEIDL